MKQTFTRFFQALLMGIMGLGLSQTTYAQYCVPTQLGGAQVTNVTFNTLNNTSPAVTAPFYTAFPASGNTFTSVVVGLSYPLTVTTNGSAIVSVWIDYDHSNTFDATEWQQVMTTGTNATITVSIPPTALPGLTGMRIRSRLSGNTNSAPDACSAFGSGECEDYTIDLVPASPCTNPVSGGTASTTTPLVCPSQSAFISTSGVSFGTGMTYQWYSSSSATGPWTAIPGANMTVYSATPATPTYYQLESICSGGTAAYSNAILIGLNSFVNCYCNANATSTADEEILNVTVGGLNQSSTCGTTGTGPSSVLNRYSDYTTGPGAPPPPLLTPTSTVPFSFEAGTCGGNFNNGFAAWIDFDQNGVFDVSEKIYASTATTNGPHTETGTFVVPVLAAAGLTRMRVILAETTVPTNPCANFTWGEVEDYLVNIQPLTPCTNPANAGTISASATAVCPGISSNLSSQGYSYGTGTTYQWYSSPSATGPWTAIAGATNTFYSVTPTANTFYHFEAICSGGAAAVSNDIQITINNFVTCYCNANATSTADEDILNVTVGTLNQSSTCTTTGTGLASILNRYSDYTTGAGAPAPGIVNAGQVENFSFEAGTCGGNFGNTFSAWIDFDHSGSFDASERIYAGTTTTNGPHIEAGTFTVPATALPGITRMRVILNEGAAPTNPCANVTWGEVEDYLIDVVPPPPCFNPVFGGTTIASSTLVCPTSSTTVTFNVQNSSVGTGLTYQWQSGPSATGPWTDITGATAYNFSTVVTTNGFYRRAIICSGGAADYSTPIEVVVSIQACFCGATATSSADEDILNVTLGTLNQSSTCTTTGTGSNSVQNRYSDYTTGAGAPTPPVLLPGSTVAISLEAGTCGGNFGNAFAVWIDLDGNGAFDPVLERVYASTTSTTGPHVENGTITIPANAVQGLARMRVILRESGSAATNPCANFNWGEVEDYLVNIACPSPTMAITAAPVCAGGNITATVNEYYPGATYDWAGNGTTASGQTVTFNNVTVTGVYTVTATTAACTSTVTASVIASTPMPMFAMTTPVTCNGTNGVITASGMDGVSPYTYLWSDAGATATDALTAPAGVYTVTMTDAIGCTGTGQMTITEPTALANSATVNNVVCNAGNTGMITTSVTGATAPYSYSWANGGTGAMEMNLVAGTYTLTVTDANSCSATYSYIVTEPMLITNAPTITNVVCNGGNSGMIALATTGGTGAFTYVWNDATTNSSLSNLIAGSYTVSVTDAVGCTISQTFTVTEPTAVMPMLSSTNATCVAGGTAMVSGMGGNAPYTYMWSNTSSNANQTGLIDGTYTVTVTDASNCTVTSTVVIAPSVPITALTPSSADALCFGSNSGTISFAPVGGTAPFTYSWSHDATLNTATASNLYAATYYVFASDAAGCTATSSVVVSEPNSAVNLVALATNQTITPANGSVSLNISGGVTPYNILWSTGATTQDLTGVAAGNYCATVTDANGCSQTACASVAFIVETETTASFTTAIAYPNPTEGLFSLDVKLTKTSNINLDIIGVLGQVLISQKAANVQDKRFELDMTNMPAGVYFARITAGDEIKLIRITLAR